MTREEIHSLLAHTEFPDGCLKAELRETHISWLILSTSYVFKIKKNVSFSFLDFSTTRQRAYFCRREVLLNSRLTDGVYLGYLPIRRVGNGYYLGGEEDRGEIIDYAVQMRRLPDEDHLPHKLRHGRVLPADMEKVGVKIAGFHQNAPLCNPVDPVPQMHRDFNDITSVFRRLLNWPSLHRKTTRAIEISNRFLEKYGERLRERVTEGWYRDGHGDLHMGNLFIQAEPIIFDCVEFNDGLRQIDVLNDLAFLSMDLEIHGYVDLNRHMLAAYQHIFNPWLNPKDEAFFLYYKMYRANVRLKVLTHAAPEGVLLPEMRRMLYRYAEAMDTYASALDQLMKRKLVA